MKFGYTIIYVADVEQTISFYKKVFNLNPSFIDETKTYGEINTGATKLAFFAEKSAEIHVGEFKKNNINELPFGFEIGLITDDVNNAYHYACEHGAISVSKPAKKPWGQTVAYVRDLNGVLVEICSPLPEMVK